MLVLSFTLNSSDFGILLDYIKFVTNLTDFVRMPDMPDYVEGVTVLHNKDVPVYSLASRFGFNLYKAEKLLVVDVNGIEMAFEVSSVNGIIVIDESMIFPLPYIIESYNQCIEKIIVYNGKKILLLDSDKLLSSEQKREVDRLIEEHRENG